VKERTSAVVRVDWSRARVGQLSERGLVLYVRKAMLARTFQLELSRRVMAYYLVFGLATLFWLSGGMVVILKAGETTRAETGCLARLGGAANLIRSTTIRGDGDFQPLMEQFQSKWGLAYCAVVSNDGRFLAHSSADRVGESQRVPAGESAAWGEIRRTRFVDGSSQVLREYRAPIKLAGQVQGILVMAAPEPNAWDTVFSVAVFAPAVFLCPMIVIVLGGVALRHTVRPMAEVESQLERLATESPDEEVRLDPITVPSRVGVGWNRLVKVAGDGSRSNNLKGGLGQALETFRQNKQEQILNGLADGVAVTDENGTITFANKAFAGLLGMETSQLASGTESIERCLSLDPAADAVRPLLDANFRNRSVIVEMERTGETSQGVLRVARSPLWSAEGDASGGHVWSVRDVTQQKLADQMRDQFVNTATHELRTPMTTIKALAEMLAESEVTDVDQQKTFCNTICEEVTRLARFVDDLLQLSRMEAGSTPPRRQATDMERLLADVVEKVRPQLEQKNIAFEVNVPAKLPELVVDKDKITGALVNLRGNAAKYTPEEGQVKFHVEVTETGLRIVVQDTGIGISAEELPKVFEKFYRASDAKVREQTGSGLGLSLTNEIVRLHGGKVTVQSEPDKGSTFTALLPLAMERVACSNA